MKFVKKLGLFAVAACVGLFVVSCGKDRAEEVIDTTGNPDINLEETTRSDITLSSISVDNNASKLNYYVGEEFSRENLVVKGNYIEVVDGANKSLSKELTNYTLDTSDLNMGLIGTYPVTITYREGTNIKTTTVNINVTSSFLDDQKIEYLAGLEPVETIIKISKNQAIDFKEDVVFEKHYLNNTVETKVEALTASDKEQLTVDEGNFSNTKTGRYVIKYSFDTSALLSDGTNYEYTLNSFVIVIVQ